LQGETMLDHAMNEMKQGNTTVAEVMGISNRVEE